MSDDSLGLGATVVASREQVSCELAEEVVILNLRNGEYYGLNPVGARIWELVQEPCTVESVRDRLVQEYPDVEPEVCTQDLLEVLAELAATELLEVRRPAAALRPAAGEGSA